MLVLIYIVFYEASLVDVFLASLTNFLLMFGIGEFIALYIVWKLFNCAMSQYSKRPEAIHLFIYLILQN